MTRNAFDADAGTHQGRCQPTYWNWHEGDYVYVLGHDVPGTVRNVRGQNSHTIQQEIDFTGVKYVRPRVYIRPPESVPVGATWMFTLCVDGACLVNMAIPGGERERLRADMVLPTYDFAGTLIFEAGVYLDAAPGTSWDLELPGIYLDDVVADSSVDRPIVCFRDPEPGETGVPATAPIQIGVSDWQMGTLSVFRIWINEQLAATESGPEPGFGASSFNIYNGTAVISVTHPAFASLQIVQVRVRVEMTDGAFTEVKYSYQIADTEGPRLLNAISTAEDRVRVTFNEPVSSALTPASYVLEIVDGLPAVLPAVVAVEAFTASSVELVLDKAMTRQATYRVTATGVADLVGNPIAPPTDTATFIGFQYQAPGDRVLDFYERFPLILRQEDDTRDLWKFSAIMQETIDLMLGLIDRWPEILDQDIAPEAWVDLMLADLGNPFAFDLTIDEKRLLVGLLVRIYKSKGTGPGIVDAIRLMLGLEVTVNVYAWAPLGLGECHLSQDWILGSSVQSDLYTFEVISPVRLTDVQRERMEEIVDYMKVAHEHHRIVEPALPIIPSPYWQIGQSLLGVGSVLSP